MAGLEPDRVPELWWTSYQKALDVGLAVEVEIPDGPAGPPGPAGPHLEVLLVTGLSDQDPRALFERARRPRLARRRHPDEPDEHGRGRARGGPRRGIRRPGSRSRRPAGGGTFDGLAAPLTGAPLLDGVADAELGLLDAVSPLVTALWPVLWQRRLKDVENAGIDVLAMGGWAARVLCPLGPYAALRVGDVPYGVLPAVDVPAWVLEAERPGLGAHAADDPRRRRALGLGGGGRRGRHRRRRGRGRPARDHRPCADRPRPWIAATAPPGARRAPPGGGARREPAGRARRVGTDGAAVLGISPEPLRRYQAFGYVQPAVRGHGGVRDLLRRYLQMSWEELAYGGHQVADRAPFLVRLLRHSLLLTQAEVSRLDPDHWPAWTAALPAPAGRRARAARHRRQPRRPGRPAARLRAGEARRAVPAGSPGARDRPSVPRRPTGRARARAAWTTRCSRAGRSRPRSRRCWTRRATGSTRGSPPSGLAAFAG